MSITGPVDGCECESCEAQRDVPLTEQDGRTKEWGEKYDSRHGSEFQEAREVALERAGYECQSCGISNEQHIKRDDLFGGGLHVHHKTATSEGGTHAQENLVVVCADCHPPEPSGEHGETA